MADLGEGPLSPPHLILGKNKKSQKEEKLADKQNKNDPNRL